MTVVIKPLCLKSIFSHLHPCDNLALETTNWHWGDVAAEQLVNQLARPKRGVFLFRWSLGIDFLDYNNCDQLKQRLRIVDDNSRTTPKEELKNERGMRKMMEILAKAGQFQLDVINNNFAPFAKYVQTLLVDMSFPQNFPVPKPQFNCRTNFFYPNLHDIISNFIKDPEQWSTTVNNVANQSAPFVRHVMFLEGCRSSGTACQNYLLVNHLSACMLRLLRVDLILSNQMPNLQTVYLPNLKNYDDITNNRTGAAAEIGPWTALLAIPPAERLIGVQRVVTPCTILTSSTHGPPALAHTTAMPVLPALAATGAQVELTPCCAHECESSKTSFTKRVAKMQQQTAAIRAAVLNVTSPFRQTQRLVWSFQLKNNTNTLVFDYLNSKQDFAAKLVEMQQLLREERRALSVWREVNGLDYSYRYYDLRFECKWLSASTTAYLAERFDKLFVAFWNHYAVLKIHLSQPDKNKLLDDEPRRMINALKKILPVFNLNRGSEAVRFQQQIVRYNLRLHIDMCGKASLDQTLNLYRAHHEELRPQNPEPKTAVVPEKTNTDGVYYLLPPVTVNQTIKFDRIDERIFYMSNDELVQYIEERISEQFVGLLRDAQEAAELRLANADEDDDAAVQRSGDYRNIVYRHVERFRFHVQPVSKTEVAAKLNWRILEQNLTEEAKMHPNALPALESVKIVGGY